MFELTINEKHTIQIGEQKVLQTLSNIEKSRQFKLGDFLICFKRDYNNKVTQVMTGYNTPQKWVVCAVDSIGCGYIKSLDSSGKPRGSMSSILREIEIHSDLSYQLDPEYVNAIILSENETFDPVEKQRYNKSLRKLITDHNKAAKVNCTDVKDLDKYMRDSMKVGDVFWVSPKKNFAIVNKTLVQPKEAPYHQRHFAKAPNVVKLEVRYSNGERAMLFATNLAHKNLYTQMPRTYKELSDSI